MDSIFKVAPSILSADFCNLQRDLELVSNSDFVHIDVMDYHFVPNLTIGEPVVERIVEVVNDINQKNKNGHVLFTDVHLMIENPDRWAENYAEMGVSSITFHYNATSAPIRLARRLRSLGVRASISLRPAESADGILDILDEFDMILVMTVEPGFGGQKFLENQMNKVSLLRCAIEKLESTKRPILQVDGGVSRKNVEMVAKAGANATVAGSAVYGAQNPREEVEIIRNLGSSAFAASWKR
ncbi:MAG: ribulose-phosphate 3-epimerase [Candidatus Ancillula sp.]|jgi:ribulose-phosphate 3-epimerase|nr:ribulose-phosphate 3-epimerase [Candidatus Ancillula sp.]